MAPALQTLPGLVRREIPAALPGLTAEVVPLPFSLPIPLSFGSFQMKELANALPAVHIPPSHLCIRASPLPLALTGKGTTHPQQNVPRRVHAPHTTPLSTGTSNSSRAPIRVDVPEASTFYSTALPTQILHYQNQLSTGICVTVTQSCKSRGSA